MTGTRSGGDRKASSQDALITSPRANRSKRPRRWSSSYESSAFESSAHEASEHEFSAYESSAGEPSVDASEEEAVDQEMDSGSSVLREPRKIVKTPSHAKPAGSPNKAGSAKKGGNATRDKPTKRVSITKSVGKAKRASNINKFKASPTQHVYPDGYSHFWDSSRSPSPSSEQSIVIDDNKTSHPVSRPGLNGHSNTGFDEDGEQMLIVDHDDNLSYDPILRLDGHSFGTSSDMHVKNPIVVDEKASRRGLNGHSLDTDSNSGGEQNVHDSNENVSRNASRVLNRRYIGDSESHSADDDSDTSLEQGPSPHRHLLKNGPNMDGEQKVVIHDGQKASSSSGPGVDGRSPNTGSGGDVEQAIVEPKSGPNGRSLNAVSNGGGGERGDGEFLWSGEPRRTNFRPSAVSEKFFRETRIYLLAMVLGGAAGSDGSVWPEQNPQWLNDKMKRAWNTMANRVDQHVTAEPTPKDARKLHDAISDWRSRAVQAIRPVVEKAYPWAECQTHHDVKHLCEALLKDDSFTFLERTADPPRGRFGADIISTALKQTFFNSGIMGVALQPYTENLFDPLPHSAVVFMCTCIEHAIREYSSGYFNQKIFKGPDATAAEIRFRDAYHSQSDATKKVQRDLLLQRVQQQVGVKKRPAARHSDVGADPDAKGIDDLSLQDLDGAKKHRPLSLNPTPRKKARTKKSFNLSDWVMGTS